MGQLEIITNYPITYGRDKLPLYLDQVCRYNPEVFCNTTSGHQLLFRVPKFNLFSWTSSLFGCPSLSSNLKSTVVDLEVWLVDGDKLYYKPVCNNTLPNEGWSNDLGEYSGFGLLVYCNGEKRVDFVIERDLGNLERFDPKSKEARSICSSLFDLTVLKFEDFKLIDFFTPEGSIRCGLYKGRLYEGVRTEYELGERLAAELEAKMRLAYRKIMALDTGLAMIDVLSGLINDQIKESFPGISIEGYRSAFDDSRATPLTPRNQGELLPEPSSGIIRHSPESRPN
ncbi:hypothetical protein JW962_01320 [Candidatus Dojkabacteria bacterium]|nr:hypothetical protein [Candidatus Dojkabacteria bacterium]